MSSYGSLLVLFKIIFCKNGRFHTFTWQSKTLHCRLIFNEVILSMVFMHFYHSAENPGLGLMEY